MAADARVHPRYHVDARADVIGDEVVLGRRLADLSVGGCSFEGEGWERGGTLLTLVLSFPALGAHLPLSGIVVRTSERDMGVKFHGLTDEQKWALRKHLKEAQERGAVTPSPRPKDG